MSLISLISYSFLVPNGECQNSNETKPVIGIIDPAEQGFYSKVLDFHGIPIKSHQVVSDEALYAAYDRLCLHEFARNVQSYGISPDARARIDEQAKKSKEKGLWLNSCAGSNSNEFFAQL